MQISKQLGSFCVLFHEREEKGKGGKRKNEKEKKLKENKVKDGRN